MKILVIDNSGTHAQVLAIGRIIWMKISPVRK
jgi:hypothetical protein